MKIFAIILLISLFSSVWFASCNKISQDVTQAADTTDRFSVEDMKWFNYKIGNIVKFMSNEHKDTIYFKVTNTNLYNYYASYHTAVACNLYFENTNKDFAITEISVFGDKNTGSLDPNNEQHSLGHTLHNNKSYNGNFPSVNSSSMAQCIALSAIHRGCGSTKLPLQNFTVSNKTYQNVYKLQMQFNKNIGATYLYVNRDFGFLRIDFEDGEVWERVM